MCCTLHCRAHFARHSARTWRRSPVEVRCQSEIVRRRISIQMVLNVCVFSIEWFIRLATLTWYYSNGTAIQTNNGESSFSSLLINATEAHNGTQFYCQMDHGDLSNQSTLSEALFVQWAPSNTSVSKEVINNGTQVNLTCSSYASPTPNFQVMTCYLANLISCP